MKYTRGQRLDIARRVYDGESPVEQEVAAYITFFNTARPAYSLKYLTPQQYKEAYAPKDSAIGVSAGG